MNKFTPFTHSIGPHPAKLAIVGEAWGQHEDMFKLPLVWWSGLELARMFSETQLTPPFSAPGSTPLELHMISHWKSTGYFYTNTFAERPPENKLEAWLMDKKSLPEGYTTPFFKPGKYFHPDYLPHVDRLLTELREVKPNLILALGNVPTWALLGNTAITKLRGSVAWSQAANCKVLPTFHPAYVLRMWATRPIVLQDFLKAKREMEFPEIRRPERWVIVSPTLDDIRAWMQRPATHYAVDIETTKGQITMIGFARSRSDAIVVPFVKAGKSYWTTHEDEVRAWLLVKAMLESDKVKIFHNGLYDLSYLVPMGFKVRNCTEDTMLLHHSLFPELKKGLEFLGSIYTDEGSWKLLRTRSKEEMGKREE